MFTCLKRLGTLLTVMGYSACASESTSATPSTLSSTTVDSTTSTPRFNNPPCKACLPATNYTLSDVTVDDIVPGSPYYTILLHENNLSKQVDNQCFTFLPLADSKYIMLYTTTNLDNKSYTQEYLYYGPPNKTGVVELLGLTTLSSNSPLLVYSFVLQPSCAGCSALYNCIPHTVVQGCNPIPFIFDPALSFAATTNPEPHCIVQSKEVLESVTGPNTIIPAPRKLPIQCVATYMGIQTTNSYKLYNDHNVLPISLP